MWVSVLLSLGLTLLLFMLLPTFIAGLFHARHAAVHNLIEGAVKIGIFLGYLILCSRQKDVRRVFCYHGAEHKTIFCYEAGLPLTVENARIQPKHHPRCGTSFLFVVIVVSILCSSIVFSYVNWQNLWVRVGMHLRVQPLCGPPRQRRHPYSVRPGHVASEFHHQRAGRLHAGGGH